MSFSVFPNNFPETSRSLLLFRLFYYSDTRLYKSCLKSLFPYYPSLWWQVFSLFHHNYNDLSTILPSLVHWFSPVSILFCTSCTWSHSFHCCPVLQVSVFSPVYGTSLQFFLYNCPHMHRNKFFLPLSCRLPLSFFSTHNCVCAPVSLCPAPVSLFPALLCPALSGLESLFFLCLTPHDMWCNTLLFHNFRPHPLSLPRDFQWPALLFCVLMPEPLCSHGKALPRNLYPYNKLPYHSFLFGYMSQLSRFLLPARPPHADVIHLVHLWILFPFPPTRYLSVLLHLPQYQDHQTAPNIIIRCIFLFSLHHMQSDNSGLTHFYPHPDRLGFPSPFSVEFLHHHYSSHQSGLVSYDYKIHSHHIHLQLHQTCNLLHTDPSISHPDMAHHQFYL